MILLPVQYRKKNEQQGLLSDILNRIGLVETEKHSLLHRVAEVNKEIEDTKVELEEQYGAVTIDLKTGEYEPIKKEEDNAVEHTEN